MADQPNTMYGRHRHSIADIEETLNNIFLEHRDHYENANGDLVIPADRLPDVFELYEERSGIELLAEDEMRKMIDLIKGTPGLEATPNMLLQLVATRSSGSPKERASPEDESPYDGWDRGRDNDRTLGSHSRSSSAGSNGTYYPGSRPPSRPPSRGANVPPSPFDAQKRQRSTPLGAVAPSSWTKRPVAPSRRKSDAGSHSRNVSDSESSSAPPTSFSRSAGGRRRTSSNSQDYSVSAISPDSSFEIASPPNEQTYSRPHSRAQSQPQSSFNMYEPGLSSPPSHSRSPARLDLSRSVYDAFHNEVSSLPMPRATSDEDSDGDDDSALGLVLDRSAASSTISMEPNERLDVLQKANVELTKKLMESERTLQIKLADHEQELEDMEMKLEEARTELTAAKREEKELRSKERSNSQQISILESEVQKLQKQYEQSRTAYSNLQKQYQEQLSQSEDLRNTLRRKDDEIQETRNSQSLMELEQSKWSKEHDAYEERIAFLEHEISVAQQTQMTLDEQKHENLMLKETIDRMRFDMDELRNGLTSHTASASGASQPGSISKSLGAELAGQLQGKQWENEAPTSSALEDMDIEHLEESDGEDVIQTIITRKKRRGLSRANAMEPLTIHDEREYADAYTQYDPAPFHSTSTTQTDPEPKILTASFNMQTEKPRASSMDIQTDPEEVPLPRVTIDMEIQTDEVEEPVPSRSPSPQPEEEEAMASSSSTVLPPTPKAQSMDLAFPPDSPPSYNTVASQSLFHNLEHLLDTDDLSFSHINDPQARRELIVAAEALKKYHKGLQIPSRTPSGGISEEAIEEWRALKEELGLGCTVIDKAVDAAASQPRKDASGDRRRGRFYNIYNTYVYGPGGEGAPSGFPGSQLIMTMAASAVVFIAMSPFLTQPYAVPGGPTYYDRAAWSSFNTMHAAGEGFSSDGTAAVWSFLGRLGGGAARVVRNWPT